MKSGDITRVETFQISGSGSARDHSVGAASLRIPRPYMARSFATTGAPSTSADLVLSGPVTGIDGDSYQTSVTVGSFEISGLSSTQKLSKDMLATGTGYVRNGSSVDLNLITSIDSRTALTVTPSTLATGTLANIVFTHSGNTPKTQSAGNFPGKPVVLPPASGKLHCNIDGLTSKTINYSRWSIDSNTPYKWDFYITGTDEASMPSINQYSEYLVAEHTTGDGLGSDVRIMWIAFTTNGNATDKTFYIKSWETGETLFEQSTANYSLNNPQRSFKVKMPEGGIMCKGGAVFSFSAPASSSFAIEQMMVGYQI
jgi:hypothetical protein